MTPQMLLGARRDELTAVIRASLGTAEHADAFAARVLVPTKREGSSVPPLGVPPDPDVATYHGYPALAAIGYALGARAVAADGAADGFLAGLERLEGRSDKGLTAFATDDVALLGVADGLACLAGNGQLARSRAWLIRVIDQASERDQWTGRLRALAGDLLDGRGRLHVTPDGDAIDGRALELALRYTWPGPFGNVPMIDEAARADLLRALLTNPSPQIGDLERAIVWLAALDALVDLASASLIPAVSDTARILASIQHGLKRWRWVDKPGRRGTMAARWLIDDEYDVQALLWTVLYPIYGAALVDETYLPGWGNVQPRVDLGITTLKLIIEVKIARQPADFAKIEEQVAGDLGLYFKDTDRFDRMIVFVYDDCDRSQAEKYDGLRNALMQREHIEDVLVVRRPSTLPNRGARAT